MIENEESIELCSRDSHLVYGYWRRRPFEMTWNRVREMALWINFLLSRHTVLRSPVPRKVTHIQVYTW